MTLSLSDNLVYECSLGNGKRRKKLEEELRKLVSDNSGTELKKMLDASYCFDNDDDAEIAVITPRTTKNYLTPERRCKSLEEFETKSVVYNGRFITCKSFFRLSLDTLL